MDKNCVCWFYLKSSGWFSEKGDINFPGLSEMAGIRKMNQRKTDFLPPKVEIEKPIKKEEPKPPKKESTVQSNLFNFK